MFQIETSLTMLWINKSHKKWNDWGPNQKSSENKNKKDEKWYIMTV